MVSPSQNVTSDGSSAQDPTVNQAIPIAPGIQGDLPSRNTGTALNQEHLPFAPFVPPLDQYGQAPLSYERASFEGNPIPTYSRILRDAGFDIAFPMADLGEFERLSRWQQAMRKRILDRIRANRARVAVAEQELYRTLVNQGFQMERPSGDMPQSAAGTDNGQTAVLFRWLQDVNAFRHFRLNEDLRAEMARPNIGHTRNDSGLWNLLRNSGYSYKLVLGNGRHGRWCGLTGPLYSEEVEMENDNFQQLLRERAFETPSIRLQFPGHDEYSLYRRVLSLGINWDSNRRIWLQQNLEHTLGDRVHASQPQQQPQMRQARDDMAQHDGRADLAERAEMIQDVANGLNINLRSISDRDQASADEVAILASDIGTLHVISDRILAMHARWINTESDLSVYINGD